MDNYKAEDYIDQYLKEIKDIPEINFKVRLKNMYLNEIEHIKTMNEWKKNTYVYVNEKELSILAIANVNNVFNKFILG